MLRSLIAVDRPQKLFFEVFRFKGSHSIGFIVGYRLANAFEVKLQKKYLKPSCRILVASWQKHRLFQI